MSKTVILFTVVVSLMILICFVCGLISMVILYLATKVHNIIGGSLSSSGITEHYYKNNNRKIINELERQREVLEFNRMDELYDKTTKE